MKAKTVSVALSQQQYLAMKHAIQNRHELTDVLARMEGLSRRFIFKNLPEPRRRKRLTNKVLVLN